MRLIVLMLLLLPIVLSTVIDVSVKDFINAEIVGLKQETYGKAIKIDFEAFNSGSVGCKSIFRIDVLQDKYSSSVWSDKIIFQPGDRKNMEFYFFPQNKTGNFTAKIMYYCANEIKEIKEFNIKNENYIYGQPSIEIISPRIFEDKIVFYVKTNSTGEFVVIPSNYPRGWIIQQKKIYIKSNRPKYVELNYDKDIWKIGNVNLVIVGKNGEYGIKDIEIRRELFINEILFRMKGFMSNLFG